MAKLWAGVTAGETDRRADDFNSSLRFDSRMICQDIRGSIAHAKMLGEQGILSPEDAGALVQGLTAMLEEHGRGTLTLDPDSEDIHMAVEQELTRRLGEVGKKLHTARSRNDQVALDLRLYLREALGPVREGILLVMEALLAQAREHTQDIMPGYTHLQRAQPVSFGHHLLAYCSMLQRDVGRLDDALRRMDVCPIGCCALAGTTYPTDRRLEAELLGFGAVAANSLDGVSDRDFCLEILSALSIVMMHLSRLAEELVLWSSWEFRFVALSDQYTTGSSIMPQKRNPDMAELIRGKTGRVYGDLMALLTVMKGLPLAYNKDMQEDKEAVFDAVDTVQQCLEVLAPMVRTMQVLPENMRAAARGGFINATDLADYLVRKGMPFRDAYRLSGTLVARCLAEGTDLESLPLEVYRQYSPLFAEDVYEALDLQACLEKRRSEGGPSRESVLSQIRQTEAFLLACRGGNRPEEAAGAKDAGRS